MIASRYARVEALNQRPQARRELAAVLAEAGSDAGARTLELHAGRLLSPDGRAPVVVSDRVAGDLVDPGGHGGGVLELAGVAVDAQQDLLEDVLGAVAVRHAAWR